MGQNSDDNDLPHDETEESLIPDLPGRKEGDGINSHNLAIENTGPISVFQDKLSFDSVLVDNDEPSSVLDNYRQAHILPDTSRIERRVSFVEGDEVHTQDPSVQQPDTPVTWRSLPRKGQLAIITLARLSEPLTQTSLQAYMFYQLKSFDPSLPDSTISSQTGVLQGAFTAAQFVTAVMWGRAADSERIGRKRVLLIGLFGTCLSCVGFGFSKSFIQAAAFRTMGGALNGNVGVMRTMISEIIKEKKYQSRAFLLLPMCFNIGVIIGPILGGLLADPIKNYPHIFGPHSLFGGKHGVWWMKHWPYALPNLTSAVFIFISAVGVILGLDETHYRRRDRPDYGRKVGTFLANMICHRRRSYHYALLDAVDDVETPVSIDLQHRPFHSRPAPHVERQDNVNPPKKKRKICSTNICLTLITHFILALHMSAFTALIFIFLPTSRSPLTSHGIITGGLGLPASQVGFATAIIGIIGLPLQIMIYPAWQAKLGTLPSYRLFLPFSALAYCLMPVIVLIPAHPAWVIWVALTFILMLQVLSRTFVLPGSVILTNNCVEDPAVLGTIHGLGQTVSSGARTVGPMLGGWGLGWGLRHNQGGMVWWCYAGVAMSGWGMSWLIKEGKGIGIDRDERKPEGRQ